MIRKLLSLRHWRHVFVRIGRLLVSPHVAMRDKAMFLLPVLLYWVLPDFLPFLPFDDIAVTMAVAEMYVSYMERKYGTHPRG